MIMRRLFPRIYIPLDVSVTSLVDRLNPVAPGKESEFAGTEISDLKGRSSLLS